MTDGPTEHIKKFVFTSKLTESDNSQVEELTVFIPERLQASYSFYTWPSAPVLAWFLWENRKELVGKRVLEIGAGTALPGIVAAKCGAKVTISESALLPESISHTKRSIQLNNLNIGAQVKVTGITWGLILSNLDDIGPLDLILGSDCFYDPSVFEDIIVTISYLLENNPNSKFLCSYQERSSDWCFDHILEKWRLNCKSHNTENLGQSVGVNILDLIGPHSIKILEFTRID